MVTTRSKAKLERRTPIRQPSRSLMGVKKPRKAFIIQLNAITSGAPPRLQPAYQAHRPIPSSSIHAPSRVRARVERGLTRDNTVTGKPTKIPKSDVPDVATLQPDIEGYKKMRKRYARYYSSFKHVYDSVCSTLETLAKLSGYAQENTFVTDGDLHRAITRSLYTRSDVAEIVEEMARLTEYAEAYGPDEKSQALVEVMIERYYYGRKSVSKPVLYRS